MKQLFISVLLLTSTFYFSASESPLLLGLLQIKNGQAQFKMGPQFSIFKNRQSHSPVSSATYSSSSIVGTISCSTDDVTILHSDNKKRTLKCAFCSHKFHNKGNLTQHSIACKKRFEQKHKEKTCLFYLQGQQKQKRTKRISEKIFTCPNPDCDMSYITEYSCNRHFEQCKQWYCQFCNRHSKGSKYHKLHETCCSQNPKRKKVRNY